MPEPEWRAETWQCARLIHQRNRTRIICNAV